MRRLILGTLLAALAASSASAGTCYQREYTAKHLRKDPNQPVTYLLILFERGAEVTAETRARFRDANGYWRNKLFCWEPDPAKHGDATLGCSVECDGGHFLVRDRGDAILVTTPGGWIVGPGGCGEEETIIRRVTDIGAAKTTFKLYRTDEASCR